MLRSMLVVLTLVICVQMFLVVEAKKKAKNQESGDCSTWTYGPCVLRSSNAGNSSAVACGRGSKQGTRTGETCAVKEKTFPCRVKCAKAAKPAKKKCKYNKGTWSECNTETNQMTKTKTLTKGDPTCPQTKTTTKPCRRPSGNNQRPRQNNRRNRE